MKPNLSEQDIQNLLERGTSEVIVKEDLQKKLLSGKKLRIKLGIDPSGADLHLGHMVVVRKLREFQKLGHQIVLLFGNFTGQIGDPTGKTQTRKMQTQEECEKNAEKYLDQVKGVLDVKKTEIVWNADWLGKLSFGDVVTLASQFTVAQMMERDMFQDRAKKDLPIGVHEFMYPLMQGYDSVAIKADVEVGGTDQTFNMLAGRVLQKAYGQEPQNVITMPILVGLDGVKKMGKSEDNFIAVADAPADMYGKTMSIPDSLIVPYFELATDVSFQEMAEINQQLVKGVNPRDLKMRLARELVTIYHNADAAHEAEASFVNVFQKGDRPEDVPEVCVKAGEWKMVDLLMEAGLVESKNEARRLIQSGAVKVDDEKFEQVDGVVKIDAKEKFFKVGKRKFARIVSK